MDNYGDNLSQNSLQYCITTAYDGASKMLQLHNIGLTIQKRGFRPQKSQERFGLSMQTKLFSKKHTGGKTNRKLCRYTY